MQDDDRAEQMVFILHFKISGVLRVIFPTVLISYLKISISLLLLLHAVGWLLFECNCTWCLSRSYEIVLVRDDIFRKPFWGN